MFLPLRNCLAFASLCLGAAAGVYAQAYPSKPVRVFVPSAAGSAPDPIARIVSDKLARALGQPVIVENKPGAGGIINMNQLRQAAADGHTLTLVQGAVVVVTPFTYKEATYDVERDFDVVGTVAETPMLIVANPRFPAKTLSEAVTLAKSKPGEIALSSASRGSIPNLTNEMLTSKSGAKFQIVPFSSTSQGIQAVVGGEVMLFTDGAAPLIRLVRAGRLRALALAGDKVVPGMEDIPLAKDSIPGFSVSGWFVLPAPKGIPPEISARLNKELNNIIAMPDVSAKFQDLGGYSKPGSIAEARQFLKSEKERFGALIRETGIKAE